MVDDAMERLRVGIVGAGIGHMHAEGYAALPERFEIAAVCDIDEARARALAADFDVTRVETDYQRLLGMDELDVIDVCTPSHLHQPMALAALRSGKHVIVEKPAAGSLRQVDELALAEVESGKRVMPVFQYRFGHGLQKLKLLRERGLTGPARLATAETHWRRRPEYYAIPWRGKWQTELGGALVTLAIHTHDALEYILGPVSGVFAIARTLANPIETEDTLVASLEMADGSLAALSVTTGSPEEISRLRFSFANLSAESNRRPYSHTGDDWSFTPDSEEAAEQIDRALAGFQPLPEGFAGQFLRFYDALQSGGELPVTLKDARRSLELITAIYASARSGQPQALPVGREHPLYEGWQPKEI